MDKQLSVLMSFSGAGGVERMMVNLITEMAGQLEQIDLLLLKANSPHLNELPDNVNVIQLKSKHSLLAIPEIAEYLKTKRPEAMLVAKDRAGRAALRAKVIAKVDTRICIRLGTNLSEALKHKNRLNRWLRTTPMRRVYKKAEKVIAVSEGVRKDTLAITNLQADKVRVVRNPVITKKLEYGAKQPCPHAWLEQDLEPVIIGSGRLSKQKDFVTLLHAFNKVNQKQSARLIILGEGAMRQELTELTEKLGLTERVLMPGFQENPHAWVSRADLFVLSSRWEGSPNVLSEALAHGVQCVATRCPSGPEEVLAEGKYGKLVEMGDYEAMADAILSLLAKPLEKDHIKQAVQEYRAEVSAVNYLKILYQEVA